LIIQRLTELIDAREESLSNFEAALTESNSIAAGIEEKARAEAEKTLATARAAVCSQQEQIGVIEREIVSLENEYILYNRLTGNDPVAVTINSGVTPADAPGPGQTAAITGTGPDEAGKSLYTIKLVSFLNARHFVSFGQKAGPVHAHSWQIQIEIKVPSLNPELVAFTSIFNSVKQVLQTYENTVLNQIPPFNKIQPTTENMALYFFNRLEDVLAGGGFGLGKLTVWETPTRGIEVTSRYIKFDEMDEKEFKEADSTDPEREIAATEEEPAHVAIEENSGWQTEAASGQIPKSQNTGSVARRKYRPVYYLAGICIIALVAFGAYYNILFSPADRHYPWGVDTWGHLYKAEFLYQEVLKGNYYPQFTEYWYNGGQPFRYWAPLPYYLLAALRAATGDIFVAGNLYLFICALIGGLFWLLFAGKMGLWQSVMAGVIWVVWIDNVRVAFSEGNLPRVLATALLPLVFIVFLNVLENKKGRTGILALVGLIHLIVLCHAMIAAIYCLCLMMFSLFLGVFRGCRMRDCLRGLIILTAGVATAAWWLLPSLKGGITGLDAEAMKNAIQFIPSQISLDPTYRFSNRETFYWGTSLLLSLFVTFITWRGKPSWARSLALCGVILMLITFPLFRLLYIIMPLSHLLWPLRFSTFAAMAMVASCLTFDSPEMRLRLIKFALPVRVLTFGLFLVLLVDCLFSVPLLINTRASSLDLLQIAERIKSASGWRVATIDLSMLGSTPSFLFSESAGREQVFGWAWQGAVTSGNIMLLNTGLEQQYYPFLFRSCVNLGATDLIVKDDVVRDPRAFSNAARQAGYRQRAVFTGISLWHGYDRPYLVAKKNICLVVGKYAGNIALQFPGVEMGVSPYIEDYSPETLAEYPMVIYSGAQWRSKAKAEKIVAEYAASGGRVYIELAGMPLNVLAKQPEFLGVYGEAVNLEGRLKISGRMGNIQLQSFSSSISTWKSYVPMGLDDVEMEFKYYGNSAPVYGYKKVGASKVWFLGGSIPYHALLTGDLAAVGLLGDILGLKPDYNVSGIIQLLSYRTTASGYVMTGHADKNTEVIVPVAFMDGIKVFVDGKPWDVQNFENLLQINLPAGTHEITISLYKTPVYYWGAAMSVGSLGFVLVMVMVIHLYRRKTNEAAG